MGGIPKSRTPAGSDFIAGLDQHFVIPKRFSQYEEQIRAIYTEHPNKKPKKRIFEFSTDQLINCLAEIYPQLSLGIEI